MSTYSGIIEKVQRLIGDDVAPQVYTSGTIGSYIVDALPYVNSDFNFSYTCTSGVFSADLTSFEESVYALRAACIVKSRESLKNASKGIYIKSGEDALDLSKGATSSANAYKDLYNEYCDLLKRYRMSGGSAGEPGVMVR